MLLLSFVACTLPLPTLSDPDTRTAVGADWVDLGDPLTDVVVATAQDGGCEAWATTGYGNLLHSEDSGRTWEVLVAGDGSNELSAIERAAGQVWAVGRRGRVVRVDGKGVEDHADGTQDLSDLALYQPDGGALSAWLAGRDGTVRYTPDGGVSWERRNPRTDADLHAIAVARGAGAVRLWAAGAEGGLWRSDDAGATWTPEAATWANDVRIFSNDILDLAFAPDGSGWGAGADGSLLRKPAGGAWEAERAAGPRARLYAAAPLRHLLDGALEAVAGGNGGALFVRPTNGAWKAARWREATRWKDGHPLTSWNGVAGAESCLLAVGDDGAVATADIHDGAPGDPAWAVVRSGWRPGLNAVSVVNEDGPPDGIAVGRGGTIFRLRGDRWEFAPSEESTNLLAADLFAPGNGWVGGLGALSRLRGDTWTKLTLPGELGEQPTVVAVDAINASSAWAFTRSGQLVYVADLLEPRLVSTAPSGPVVAGCASGDAVLVATPRGIHRWLPNSGTWSNADFPGETLRSLSCDTEGRAWAAAAVPGTTSTWGVYVSGDAGATWTFTGPSQSVDLFGLAIGSDGRRGVAVGGTGSALTTQDAWETARADLGQQADVFEATQGIPRLRDAAIAGESTWAVGDSLTLLSTTGTDTWRDVSPSFRSIIDLKDEILVVTDGSWLLSSPDAGRTWEPVPGCGVMGIRDGVATKKGALLVGERGALVTRHGTGCHAGSLRGVDGASLADDTELRAVAESGGELWIVGEAGAVFHGTPEDGFSRVEWPKKSARSPVDLNDVAALQDGSVWIVGDDGVLLTWAGDALEVVDVPTGASERDPPLRDDLRGVRVADGTLWVVGEHGTVLQSTDGTVWRQRRLPTTEDLEDIVLSGDVGWIVGSRGSVLETRDGGHAWDDVSGNNRAHLRAVAVGGALRDGGLIVGDGATLLQAHRVDPPPAVESEGAVRTASAITWDLSWVGDTLASTRYRASAMHLRVNGKPWEQVDFTAESTGAGLRLVVPDSKGPAAQIKAEDAFQARVTLTDGRRRWEILLAESSWKTWVSATPEYLQYAIGFLLFPGFGLGFVWMVRPRALLRAPSEEERGTLQGIIVGASRFLGPWAAPLTMLLQFMVPLQRTARVRTAWLELYRQRAYHLNAVPPGTLAWYLRAPAVQRALVERYQPEAFIEVQRALGVDPTEGVLRPPAVVTGKGATREHLVVFRREQFRAGVVHIHASSVEGAPEYLFATALLACEGREGGQVGAIPIIVHDKDTDILGAVTTALRGLLDEADREAVTPALTTELIGLGCVAVLFTAPTLPDALLGDIRALRRGWPKALVLVATQHLGAGGADIHVEATAWPMERALTAVDIVLNGEPESELTRVRGVVEHTLRTSLGATTEHVDLPPRLLDAIVRRAHDSPGQPTDQLAADAIATWLIEALDVPPTQTAAWLDAIGRLAGFGWDPATSRVRPLRFDATVQREVGPAANDVLNAAAHVGILVGAVHHGRYEWTFRHPCVARLLASGAPS